MNVQELNELIRKRRSIFPRFYIEKEIPEQVLQDVLENANWAPTHRKTEPWRFKIFKGDERIALARYLADHYKANTKPEAFSENKHKKKYNNVLKTNTIIAIVMQRDPKESVPEWEEVAAIGAAVQNMQLTCHAYGIGCYWSSPKAMNNANEFLGLQEGQKCLGLLYMGYHEAPELPGNRGSIAEKMI